MQSQNALNLQQFRAGELIFSAGDIPDCAYIIESGEIEIISVESDQPINVLGPGNLLGEMGVVDSLPRTTTAKARTAVSLLVIDRNQITERIARTDPIVRALVEVLLHRFRLLLPGEAPRELPKHLGPDRLVSELGLNKFKLENALRQAIEQGQVQTVFQPIHTLRDRRIAGYEALSRWSRPDGEVISPDEFIALAEETDLILEVGYLSFQRACELLQQIQRDQFVSINVSVRQLDCDEFLNRVVELLHRHDIDTSRIKLEITETMILDAQRAKAWIKRCHEIGFSVCADDFGTGYSGLVQLSELDYDFIKIDKKLIENLHRNARTAIILKGVVEMARALNLKLVAEGVENNRQLETLKTLGVDYGQGFHFGRPVSLQSISS